MSLTDDVLNLSMPPVLHQHSFVRQRFSFTNIFREAIRLVDLMILSLYTRGVDSFQSSLVYQRTGQESLNLWHISLKAKT